MPEMLTDSHKWERLFCENTWDRVNTRNNLFHQQCMKFVLRSFAFQTNKFGCSRKLRPRLVLGHTWQSRLHHVLILTPELASRRQREKQDRRTGLRGKTGHTGHFSLGLSTHDQAGVSLRVSRSAMTFPLSHFSVPESPRLPLSYSMSTELVRNFWLVSLPRKRRLQISLLFIGWRCAFLWWLLSSTTKFGALTLVPFDR